MVGISVPRFFAPEFDPESPLVTLPADEAHHLTRVLRLGVGATIRVFDGRGREWLGRVAAVRPRAVTVEIEREVTPVPEPAVQVTLAIGLLKGDQMDTVVRDATMLGVSAIKPMATEHITLPKQARRRDATERWRLVAVASAKQCGRAVVPAIAPMVSFAEVVERDASAVRVMCVEPAHRPGEPAHKAPATLPATRPPTALLLVGPEGGWSDAEIDHVTRRGATWMQLGPRTLRAESAPTVALSALWTRWGW